jgi:hypothetical protein
MNTQTTHTCQNCNHRFNGKYCNHCGEKVLLAEDKKLSRLFEEGFHFLTHFDNRFFHSLRLIFLRPGLVAKEYTEGKRKKHYSPFSLFLVAVFLYLLFPTLQGLNISFYNHINNNHSIGIDLPWVWAQTKISHEHISLQQLSEKFDHLSPKLAKILLIILVPLTALALRLLFGGKKRFFYDHFIFAAEYLSFFILFVFFLLPLVFSVLRLFTNIQEAGDSNLAFMTVQVIVIWWAAGAGIRRFYQTGIWKSAAFSLLFLLLLAFVVFFIYRWILFAIVMLFI